MTILKGLLLIPESKYFLNYTKYRLTKKSKFYPKNEIILPQNSQGIKTIEKKYKIIWNINHLDRFFFTEQEIVIPMGVWAIISSDSKDDMLYLFALVNSAISKSLIYKGFASIAHEKSTFSLSIKILKEYLESPNFRFVPKRKNQNPR